MRCPAAPAALLVVGALGAVAADPPVPRPTSTPAPMAPKPALPSTNQGAAPLPEFMRKPDLKFDLVPKGPPEVHNYELRLVNAGNAATGADVQLVFHCQKGPPPSDPIEKAFWNNSNPCFVFHGAKTVQSPLAAGESRLLFGFQLNKASYSVLKAVADPNGKIAEKDETNNVLDLLAPP